MQRIPSLDGLRAISIALVIVAHFRDQLAPDALGAFGVQVFFVISGFLITSLLQQEEQRTGRISLRAFYRRRAFRILPAAYFFVLLIALMVPISRPYLPYTLTFTTPYASSMAVVTGHLWSLSVEETFYLLWPCALVLAFRYRGAVAAAAVAGAAIFRLHCFQHVPSSYLVARVHAWFPGVMDSIAVGCLLAIYHPVVRKYCGWIVKNTLLAASLPFATWLLAWWLWRDTWTSPIRRSDATLLWALIPAMIALCVHVAIERQDWILNNRAIQGVGVLSYSLYLWQQPATMLAKTVPGFVCMAAALGMSLLSYFCVEKPALQFKKKSALRLSAVMAKGQVLAAR